MLVALIGLLAWTAVETTRHGAATRGMPELERDSLYLALLWAALLIVRRGVVTATLVGLLAGISGLSAFSLGRYLLAMPASPNALQGRLLYEPLGYANAEGMLAAFGVLLGLGLAVHGSRVAARALAAASLVPATAVLAFSESRGAEAALVVGIAVLLALDPERRRCAATAIAVLPLPLLAVIVGRRSQLGEGQASAVAVAHDGRVVAGLLVLLTAASFVIALHTLAAPRSVGRVTLPVSCLLALAVAGFAATRASALGDRPAYWRAAWTDFVAHPFVGSGPGTFASAWLRYRTVPHATLDAHNLYLQTLAELGPLGLALLAAFLVWPLVAARSAAKRHPYGAAAAGAYAAFVVHAGLDWDWQMPVLTAVAIVVAAAVIAAASEDRVLSPWTRSSRLVAVAAMVALAGAAGYTLMGNRRLSAASGAATRGACVKAERLATDAARWQPWSAEPYVLIGDCEARLGRSQAAAASFSRAIRLEPTSWRGWYGLAVVEGASAGVDNTWGGCHSPLGLKNLRGGEPCGDSSVADGIFSRPSVHARCRRGRRATSQCIAAWRSASAASATACALLGDVLPASFGSRRDRYRDADGGQHVQSFVELSSGLGGRDDPERLQGRRRQRLRDAVA